MEAPLAIVQARMSSTRLPGKVLADLGGEPMLSLLVRRLARARSLGRIVVATTTEDLDDPIAELAASLGVAAHRGPRDDVLTRFIEAADGHDGPVVRITGDSPLVDPGLVDHVVDAFREARDVAYVSNVEPRTYPQGLDVEVLSAAALAALDDEAREPADREHVTLLARRDPEGFPRVNVEHHVDLSGHRWTVDYAEDLAFMRLIVGRLGERRYDAGLDELLRAFPM